MNKQELNEMLRLHELWIKRLTGGVRADLIGDELGRHQREQDTQEPAERPEPAGSSLPLIEFIEEIENMIKLYSNRRYTQAEAQRDKLAEKLDDIMRLGGNDR